MAVRADLNGIKTQLQTNFLAANTTTASPIDLSSSMTRRVKQVLTVNPAMIPMQASYYPLVTCYISGKDIKGGDIAKDQLNAKRECEINVEVAGACWNNNTTDKKADAADNDINYLMENIELVLRNDPNLSGKVVWQRPGDVSYYSTGLDEQSHLRFGILKLSCKLFY